MGSWCYLLKTELGRSTMRFKLIWDERNYLRMDGRWGGAVMPFDPTS